MGTRSLGGSAFAWTILLVVVGLSRSVLADPKGDIAAKSKEAMESYDLMDYDAAKKSLTAAIAAAKKAKLDKDPVVAKVHLYLGIASFAGGDANEAKTEFVAAATIDPKIQIDAAYKSPELVKLLEQAKSEVGGKTAPANGNGGTKVEPVVVDDVDCSTVKGLQHNIIDTAKAGGALAIEAHLGSDISPVKVSVMYRAEHASDFVEGKLTKQGGCKYTGAIPAAAMRGALIHYYVAAYDTNNKVIAGKGSSGSPNILEISGKVSGGGGGGDTENPLGNTKVVTPPKGSTGVTGGVIAGGKPAKVFIAVAGGTGVGYVVGDTEGGNTVQNCCISNPIVQFTPELGYYVNERLSIGLAARIGLPLGVNVNAKDADTHSTIAPAGLIRVRYGLTGNEGVRVMGQIGGGIMRNTIKLEQMGTGDTDIVGQGPLLIGAGVGYSKKLSGNIAFIGDLSVLGGIAVVKELGGLKVNNGASADVSLGLAVGF